MISYLVDKVSELNKKINVLEKQIEKMKVCGNCNHNYVDKKEGTFGCDFCNFGGDNPFTWVCDKWEMRK